MDNIQGECRPTWQTVADSIQAEMVNNVHHIIVLINLVGRDQNVESREVPVRRAATLIGLFVE